MFKPIKHVFATFLRKLCKTDGCSQKEYGWKSEETWAGHGKLRFDRTFCRAYVATAFREAHPPLNGNSCAAAVAAARHFRWPSSPLCTVPGISPNHNGITSKRRLGESDFIIWGCGDVCADRKKGARGPLAPLPCQPAFFFFIKHTHTHQHTDAHIHMP